MAKIQRAEDLADAVRRLVVQALNLCARADGDELELVEILLRDAVDVLDDSSDFSAVF